MMVKQYERAPSALSLALRRLHLHLHEVIGRHPRKDIERIELGHHLFVTVDAEELSLWTVRSMKANDSPLGWRPWNNEDHSVLTSLERHRTGHRHFLWCHGYVAYLSSLTNSSKKSDSGLVPKVEDMTGFTVSASGCHHPVLFFGSGGYYVICSQCSQMWVAKDPMSDQPDPNFASRMTGLSNKDARLDPNADPDDLAIWMTALGGAKK